MAIIIVEGGMVFTVIASTCRELSFTFALTGRLYVSTREHLTLFSIRATIDIVLSGSELYS